MAAMASSVARLLRVKHVSTTAAPAKPRKKGHQFGFVRLPVVMATAHRVKKAAITAEKVSVTSLSLVSNRHPAENPSVQMSFTQK